MAEAQAASSASAAAAAAATTTTTTTTTAVAATTTTTTTSNTTTTDAKEGEVKPGPQHGAIKRIWRDVILALYPDALSRTYCVPPLHFFRVPLQRGVVPGTTQPAYFLLNMGTVGTSSSDSSSPKPTEKKKRAKRRKKNVPATDDEKAGNSSCDLSASVSANQKAGGPSHDSASVSVTANQANQKTGNPSRDSASTPTGTEQGKYGDASRDITLVQSERMCEVVNSSPSEEGDQKEKDEDETHRDDTGEAERGLWNVDPPNPDQPDVNVTSSDLQDDFAQNHVLVNLQKLGESGDGEVMFIVSQLKFKNYLNKPSYAPAADDLLSSLPTIRDADTKDRRGEFDVLVFHRHRGILVGELKSVGLSTDGSRRRMLWSRSDEDVAIKLKKAITQLDKSERVLKTLLGNVLRKRPEGTPPIRKTVFLPYIRRAQFRAVLEADSALKKDLARCLGIPDVSDVGELCCCYEQLSRPESHEDVDANTLRNLHSWFDRALPPTQNENPFFADDDTYLEIVGKFVGPASTVEIHCHVPPHVEVRTKSQAIQEYGRRLERLVLTFQQLGLMENPPPQLCLTGPPGTGKTVMMVLMAIRWLQAGHDVYVLSTYRGSLAVSFLIERQLNLTLTDLAARQKVGALAARHEVGALAARHEVGARAAIQEVGARAAIQEVGMPTSSTLPGRVHHKFYDVINTESGVQQAIEELTLASAGKPSLHVLMDEAKFTTSDLSAPQSKLFHGLSESLKQQRRDLYFWAACMGNEGIPEGMESIALTVPLRCAPQVQRLMGPAMTTFKIHHYSTDGVAYNVGDGFEVKQINHTDAGHSPCQWPLDCEQCGREVARELTSLGVGTQGPTPKNSPPLLKYKDVFVLTRAENLRDDVEDDAGHVVTSASGAVKGLREGGILVTVLKGRPPAEDDPRQREQWLCQVKDAALAFKDHVIAAHHVSISGLERKVLVFLPGDSGDYDRNEDPARVDARDKLYVVSRCTTQFINVLCNRPNTPRGL